MTSRGNCIGLFIQVLVYFFWCAVLH